MQGADSRQTQPQLSMLVLSDVMPAIQSSTCDKVDYEQLCSVLYLGWGWCVAPLCPVMLFKIKSRAVFTAITLMSALMPWYPHAPHTP